MSSLSKEETKRSLIYTIVCIVVALISFLISLAIISNNIGVIILTFSLALMTIGIVSLIVYFVNPEISYGMWISPRKSKNIDNKNVKIGRIIMLVIAIIGICIITFVMYAFVKPQ